MERTALALALALAAFAAPAHATTTQQFFDLCGESDKACVKRIDEVRAAAEKAGTKFCPPTTTSREGYANEVIYWIDEQTSLDMNQDDAKSITSALKALYPCNKKP
ncbi:MAG: hypothetical protein GC190_12795 [Alphaproteobacteria bacterium]|nr:hypothetical protein [Alphaproteobacteria bacterium]